MTQRPGGGAVGRLCVALAACWLYMGGVRTVGGEVSVIEWVRGSEWAARSNRMDQAESLARKAIEADPGFGGGWRQLGVVLHRQGKAIEAAEALERSVRLAPDQVAWWRDLAHARWAAGRREGAIDAMEKTGIQGGGAEGEWRVLGRWLWDMERREPAIDAMRRAVAADANDGASWKALGHFLWETADREGAIDAWDRACRLGTANMAPVVSLAVGRLCEEGEIDRALALHRAWLPEAGVSATGIELAERGRLRAAVPLLEVAWAAGERSGRIGAFLALGNALDGRCESVALYAAALLKGRSPTWAEDADLLLDAAALCVGMEGIEELLDRMEVAGLTARTGRTERVTAILERTAEDRRVSGQTPTALRLFRRVLDRDPNRSCWVWVALLARQIEGEAAGIEALEMLRRQTASRAVRTGTAGFLALWRGDDAAAEALMAESLDADPDPVQVRFERFGCLIRLRRWDEARREAAWVRDAVEGGQPAFRSYLAEMWMALGEWEKALALWETLYLSSPHVSHYAVQYALALDRQCEREGAIRVLRGALAYDERKALLYELLAELEAAAGRWTNALAWSTSGLSRVESRGLLRSHAEFAEAAGWIVPDRPVHATNALASARRYLDQDGGYVPMAWLLARGLWRLGMTNQAAAYCRDLLDRNPAFVPALTLLRDGLARAGDAVGAREVARSVWQMQPFHPGALRRLAVSEAECDRLGRAVRALRPFGRMDPFDATPVFLVDGVSACQEVGRRAAGDVEAILRALTGDGRRLVAPSDLGPGGGARVVLILKDADAETFDRLDAVLRDVGGRIVYAADAGVLAGSPRGMPSPDRLARGVRDGRWVLASTGPAGGTGRALVGPAGLRGNPLTHRLPDAMGVVESHEARSRRLADWMERSRSTGSVAQPVGLLYPWGDFGQLSFDSGVADREALREATAAAFAWALYTDDDGYVGPEFDPLRIPAKRLPSDWTTNDVLSHVRVANPAIGGLLDLAKVLYWNRQHEIADRCFRKAAEAGADAWEVAFNRGANAYQQGDIRVARREIEEASMLRPDDGKAAAQLDRIERAESERIEADVGGWWDNEGRSHSWYGATGDWRLEEGLRLGLFWEWNRWATTNGTDRGAIEGRRWGAQGEWFLADGMWLEARIWRLMVGELRDHSGGDMRFHWSNPWLWGGFIELGASRHEIETVEALREGIFASTWTLDGYGRALDVLDMFWTLSRVGRDDGNNTSLVAVRMVYRIRDWPYVGGGYAGRFADSDSDPPQYWAPERLEQHQAYVNLRGHRWGLSWSASAQCGYARERDTDWRFVWGARADMGWDFARRLRFQIAANYHESPDYDRTTLSGGIRAIW